MTKLNIARRKKENPESHNQHRVEYPELVMKVISEAEVILEVLDARFWKETRNFEIEKEIRKKGKKIIYVLNKADLVDRKKIVAEMMSYKMLPYVFVSCKNRRGSSDLRKKIKIEAKRLNMRKVNIGLIGYPNTGKSSLINLMRGSRVSRVSPESGYTKGIQRVKISEGIYIIDTPGVIPSYENANKEDKDLFKHTQINVRTWDKVKEPEMLINSLIGKYPLLIENFYDINSEGDSEILLEELGRKKGFLLKGNEVDKDRTARLILRDFQEGKIRI
ncbi:MAG: GTPase [Nanoarchaeota archaeon]|nr:GTPase [Nanoarchaeota archaeon]